MSQDVPSWLSLDPDESLRWTGRPRLAPVALLGVVTLAIPAIAITLRPDVVGGLAGLGIWAAIVAAALVYVRSFEYAVSTSYLYAKRGVVGRSVTQVALANVQNATLRQGVVGRVFGHGWLTFSSAGSEGAQVRFVAITDPVSVKADVDALLPRHRSRHASRGGGEDPDPDTVAREESDDWPQAVADLLSEARTMRAAAEGLRDALVPSGSDATPPDSDGTQPSTDPTAGGDRS